ncbi:glycoside hydrolase family 18 protein [Chitinilyticum litopenaei]|uniref:glycoside hydrolase family 18 protein n=1 Tax=Chitinilyticum litopenaei TaxID=1121276 RepID=UPI0003F63FB0|nr:glycosyl hydrolase family 18 protein [Chitinilyticum litopenaei]
MSRILIAGSLLGLAALSAPLAAADKLVSYLPTWKDAGAIKLAGERLPQLTHGILSFIEVNEAGEAFLAPATKAGAALWQAELAKAKKANPEFVCLWAIGGWTGSKNIAKTARSEAGRAKLIKSSIAIMRDSQCSGLDLDWEHPVTGGDYAADASAADLQNWVSLLREFRVALDAAGKADKKRYELSAAVPALNGGWVLQGYDLKAALPSLDFVNLMAYDYAGGWSKTSTLQAALHPVPGDPDGQVLAISKAVEYYRAQGAKPEQLVLGVPFYGRALGNVAPGPRGDGLAQPMSGPGLKDAGGDGTFAFAELGKYLGKDGWQLHRSKEAGNAPYLYHAGRKELLTYDDAESLAEKVKFVKAQKLGGLMIWEITQDDAKHTLFDALKGTKK